jgi:hypothetical protein
MTNEEAELQEERNELLPVMYMLIEALKINGILDRENCELQGWGYAISWRKL